MMLLLGGCMEMCGQTTGNKLFLPKDSEKAELAKNNDPKKALTVILGSEDEIFYYTGNFRSDTVIAKTGYKGIRGIIKNKKSAIGDGFVVLIKPSGSATYKNTVDILDEMAINDIRVYALVDITKEEESYLGLKSFNAANGYENTGPKVKEEKIDENKDMLLIVMNGEGNIEYGFGKGTKQKLTLLPTADSSKFGARIKELISGKSGFDVIIKGDNDAAFPTFKTVIEALKANELYKFKMVTTED